MPSGKLDKPSPIPHGRSRHAYPSPMSPPNADIRGPTPPAPQAQAPRTILKYQAVHSCASCHIPLYHWDGRPARVRFQDQPQLSSLHPTSNVPAYVPWPINHPPWLPLPRGAGVTSVKFCPVVPPSSPTRQPVRFPPTPFHYGQDISQERADSWDSFYTDASNSTDDSGPMPLNPTLRTPTRNSNEDDSLHEDRQEPISVTFRSSYQQPPIYSPAPARPGNVQRADGTPTMGTYTPRPKRTATPFLNESPPLYGSPQEQSATIPTVKLPRSTLHDTLSNLLDRSPETSGGAGHAAAPRNTPQPRPYANVSRPHEAYGTKTMPSNPRSPHIANRSPVRNEERVPESDDRSSAVNEANVDGERNTSENPSANSAAVESSESDPPIIIEHDLSGVPRKAEFEIHSKPQTISTFLLPLPLNGGVSSGALQCRVEGKATIRVLVY